MRITRTRAIVQAFFFGLFVWLALVTTAPRLKGYPGSWLLELDPLVAVSTALATHSLYRGLLWALLVVLLTIALGRFFCGWVCPFGALHHFVGWLARPADPQRRIEHNRYRRVDALKYYLLAGLLAAAILGSLQIGWLDPLVTISRAFTTSVWPAVDAGRGLVTPAAAVYRLSWVLGLSFVLLLAVNLVRPRWFCRVLCPLGALLGVLARFAWWRIDRDPEKCTGCDLCLKACEGAADPQSHLRKAECHVCVNSLDDCQYGALSFRFLPDLGREVTDAEVSGRRLALGALAGLIFVPFSRAGGEATKRAGRALIRPPGALAEPDFLARCTKCGQCLRVCPTNVLQPAFFEAGIEGFATPVLDNRLGYCELNCVLCGQVCETGAIERITLERKLGLGEYDGRPIRLGTAFFDHGRCLPWSMDTACVVCEEVCPTSPKAIFTKPAAVVTRAGQTLTLRQPYVEPERCIGCGICEHVCPVADVAGVRVTPIGETRAPDRAFVLS